MNSRRPRLILIGSSTGGIEALTFLLRQHHSSCPPVIISQHILPNFCANFAHHLSLTSGCPCSVIIEPTDLIPGHVYVQNPESRLSFHSSLSGLRASPSLIRGPSIFRPCIDDLFFSASNSLSSFSLPILAFVLTGMGSDGAQGLLALKNLGHATVVQDQASSVVYGMPKAALAINDGAIQMNLLSIRSIIQAF